jgi:dephospho-CoA kinase
VRSSDRKPIIGLTGGIGAGKSLVADIMRELGAAVVDSDRLAHQELSDREVVATLREWWGESVTRADGEIDRKAVAAIVFADSEELKRLEGLLYPRIDRRRRSLVEGFERDGEVRAIVYDAPKLFEAGLDRKCDCIVFVDATWDVRVRRAARSRGWDEAELQKREKMQDPLEPKKAIADYVVANQFDVETLRSAVEQVFSSVLASFPT